MYWRLSNSADSDVRPMADRHYSRQTIGATQFCPPGRKLVLKCTGAYWTTSWPFAEYVRREWKGAWLCAAFRRESNCQYRATELIVQAIAATRWKYGTPPEDGMVTMIDERKVRPTKVHGKNVYGWTYRKVGFVDAEPPRTKGGLLVLQLHPDKMPEPAMPRMGGPLAQLLLEELA